MPRFILKCDPDIDMYLEWSTVVDAPTAVGTRAQFETLLSTPRHGWFFDKEEEIKKRLDRTDIAGTSTLNDGDWKDKGFIYKGQAWIPRKNLLAYAYMLLKDENAEPVGLLEPLEEDK